MAAPLFPYNLPIEGLNQENSVYYGSYVTPITLRLRMDDIANYYGFGFDQDYKDFPCKCKSKNCVGYIVRSESRWRIKKFKKNKS